MGDNLPDKEFCFFLMSSLPESWDIVIRPLILGQGTVWKLTSEELIGILIDHWNDMQRRNTETAMYSKVKRQGHGPAGGGKRQGNQNPNADKVCNNCNKKGHVRNNCWAPGGGAEGQYPSKSKKGRSQPKTEKAHQAEATNDTLPEATSCLIAPDMMTIATYSKWVMVSPHFNKCLG
jgi:hypothetical protein